MVNLDKAMCENKEFYACAKSHSSYSFCGIFPAGDEYKIKEYTIDPNTISFGVYKISKIEAIDCLKESKIIDNTFMDLFESIYSYIGNVTLSLIMILVPEVASSYLNLELSDIAMLEFNVSSYDSYDSYYASGAKLSYTIKDNFWVMEKNRIECFLMEYVPDPPFLFEMSLRLKGQSQGKKYSSPLQEKLWNSFDATFGMGFGLWRQLCNSIFKHLG